MNITGQLSVTLGCNEAISDGIEAGSLVLAESAILPFVSGTTAGQCDLKWSKSSTLAPGANDTWTLSAMIDGLARIMTFARVNYLLIETGATAEGDDLTIGGAATNPWAAIGGTFPVKSLGIVAMAATNASGYPVVAGSSDQLKVSNAGTNPITYRIALIGRSA